MTNPKIILLTGEIESGKTNLCLEIAELARESGIKVAGLVSPAVFDCGAKTAIDVQDLLTGERHRLAELRDVAETKLETKRWSFFPEIVSWGNQVLQRAIPCDLLIIDELGPLEFNRAQGWFEAFKVIETGKFQVAFLVIRPSLVQQASSRWDITRVIDLPGSDHKAPSGQELLAGFHIQP